MIYLPPHRANRLQGASLGVGLGSFGSVSPESTSAGTEPLGGGAVRAPPGPTSNPTGDTRLWVFFFVFFHSGVGGAAAQIHILL